MRDHDDDVAAIEKLTLALMFTPEVEIVTLFLLTFRNISAGNLSTRADVFSLKVQLAFTNRDLVAIWSDVDAIVSFIGNGDRR